MLNKVKWLAAVSVLAVGIPMVAFAAPGENHYQDKLITPTEQQNILTNADTKQKTQQPAPQDDQTAGAYDNAQQSTSSTTVPGSHPGHTGVNDGHHNNATSVAQSNQSKSTVTNPGYHNSHTGMNNGCYGNTGMGHNSGGHHHN